MRPRHNGPASPHDPPWRAVPKDLESKSKKRLMVAFALLVACAGQTLAAPSPAPDEAAEIPGPAPPGAMAQTFGDTSVVPVPELSQPEHRATDAPKSATPTLVRPQRTVLARVAPDQTG